MRFPEGRWKDQRGRVHYWHADAEVPLCGNTDPERNRRLDGRILWGKGLPKAWCSTCYYAARALINERAAAAERERIDKLLGRPPAP